MTNPGRPKPSRRRSSGQLVVAGLIGLAVVASLFVVFSDSVVLLRVGVVIGAWAAVLGAIALTKYQRESALDKAKTKDLQTVYELQLDREIAARREYELTVEQRVRREVGADASEMAALRAELAALRKSLETLYEGALPTERIALRADSPRIQEIGSRYEHAQSGLFVPGSAQRPQDDAATNGEVDDEDAPLTAETTEVPEVAPRPAPAPPPAPAPQAPAPPPAPRREPAAWTAHRAPEPEPEPVAEPESQPEPAVAETAEPDEQPRRRRRRALEDDSGAHTGGLSVAEIIANMQASDDSGGGRRRRAD
ncbi:hypothetical protein DW322_02235 [Rhodococcus rhodnii]|uniref:DUF6779 domain-containing protein n=1 Tax=Rhodococcus rhodnii TaxID=38312 RepID=A0A6P2CEE1_9NOCA|nr:DUF6779 domain-containing protein [Rhodococcus rhodnii]TXG89278.1 hypothetical protein DW322_02235 [Rhodococcus rhodnii]